MQFFAIRAKTGGLWFAILLGIPIALIFDWIVLDGFIWQSKAHSFPKAMAVVTRSEIIERRGSKGGTKYSLELTYQFSVGEQRHSATRLRYYSGETTRRSEAEQLHSEYRVGRSVVAYYPPESPDEAILRPGVEGTDYLRALFALGVSLLVFGGIRIAMAKQFGFNPNDPECVQQTDNGWVAQLPYTSHGGVFSLTLSGACLISGLGLTASHGDNPPSVLVGAGLAVSIAIASVAAVIFSRYPTLSADLDAKVLILPATWLSGPVKVPFEQIGTIAVREEEKSAGKGETYVVYNCEIGWGTSAKVQITTIATFLDRVEAERLVTWVKMALGRIAAEATVPESFA
ncbi:MAG: DUF3592 domain-containing protein [Planctomycetes bacterium]|nr:DUF3592 domain-containing protein [Planctomycetota bacterium]